MISSPSRPVGAPDRLHDCEVSLMRPFAALVEQAENAGWMADEVALALFFLAENYVLSRPAMLEVDGEASDTIDQPRQA